MRYDAGARFFFAGLSGLEATVMIRGACVVVVTLYGLLHSTVCWADESSEALRRQFEAEYPAALHALEHYYSHVVMEVRDEWTIVGAQANRPPARKLEFASRGQSVRLIVYPAASSLKLKDPEARVQVANPRVSFSLSRTKGGEGFSVNGIDPYEGRLSTMRLDAWPLFGAYCVHNFTVRDFTLEPGFKWTRFEALGGDDDLVRAEFYLPDSPQGDPATVGWFLFTRSGSWALRGWRLADPRNPDKGYSEAEISYRPKRSPQGIPILSKVVYRVYVADEKGVLGVYSEQVWTFSRVEPSDVPEAAFTLPAFGLPDVAPEIDPRQRMRWILLAGMVAIALGILLAWVRNRRGRRLATAP